MAEYSIHPWDTEDFPSNIDLEMNIPPEIDELAQKVVSYYDMDVRNKTLITSKPDKGGVIWKIETDQGPRSLKVLHRKPTRSLFSIGAQDYILKQGGRVPELKKTKEGLLYVEKGGKLWIVTDWIESLSPASKDLEGARALCYGLGEFHRHTRGYIPPIGSQKASRLYGWPDYYRKIITKIKWFRDIAKAYNEIPGSQSLLSSIEIFERQALDSLSHLEQSSYVQMASLGEEHWGLVHQDFGWSNGQLGPGGLWVIDLDGVAYDFPVRDLRKLISGTMDDMGRWDVTWIHGMLDAYHQANPLDLETYEILLNDLAFPNEFYKQINEMLFDPVNFISNNLEGINEHLFLLEETKCLALNELQQDRRNFLTGSYGPKTVFKTETLEMLRMKENLENTALQSLESKKNSNLKPSEFQEGLHIKNNTIQYEVRRDKKKLRTNTDHKLKVLMICTEKLPVPPVRGGAIQTYIQGVSGILSTQHDLTILGTTDPSLPQEEYTDNIRYVRIDGRQVFEIYAQEVIAFLKCNSFDLIHVFNRPRLIPLVRAAASHSRIILSMHNDMFNHDKIHSNDALTAIDEVERIITISDYVGNTICNLYPQADGKVHTIYSGVNLNTFIPWEKSNTAAQIRNQLRQKYKLESKTVILFVGRLTPKKGIDVLIHALNKAYSSDPNIALVVVGGTWYSDNKVTDYVAYVRTLADRASFPVITTGYVSADLVHQWFWAGDIFVCPSQWQEPLARVHYEAMAAGLPFLTTARGGNPEVVIGENGLIVEQPEDTNEFAEKLKILLSDPKLRRIMGQNGRRLAEMRFGWERVAQEILKVWKLGSIPITNIKGNKIQSSNKIRNLEERDNVYAEELVQELNKTNESGSSGVRVTQGKFIPLGNDYSLINYDIPSVARITRDMIVH
ncbi:CotS family spore coat protein [Desulfosporosinus sp. SB140]|uniref:CotS family spore coat protein n=1 Tax=Desulfosporosinus paludis TaxID=3115649 RepID=UPI00388D7286